MRMMEKKNPPLVLMQAITCWWSLRHTKAFTWRDAFMNARELLLPSRIAFAAKGRALEHETEIRTMDDGTHAVRLPSHELTFYWRGDVTNNLYGVIDQEFNPRAPHHYTTDPIRLTPQSRVLDVGACEGLFAYRVLKGGLAHSIVCFEPSAGNAHWLEEGARVNGLARHLDVVIAAVSSESGTVYFEEGPRPDACRILTGPSPLATAIQSVSLDDYCHERGLVLTPNDLIKIDAEGADLDVLRGAEMTIRSSGVQIAVTTYHVESHAAEIVQYLRDVRPDYCFRVKGLTLFRQPRLWGGPRPRPVLLQAALPGIPPPA